MGGQRHKMYVYDHDRYKVDCRTGIKPRKERTRNMARESVTLDVSKLSGWLNDDADCRANREQCLRYEARKEPGEKGSSTQIVKRTRTKRTPNMWRVLVTMDVSKYSGWLNALAPCRKRKDTMSLRSVPGGEGGRDGVSGTRRNAHVEHVSHVRDDGRINA